MSFSARKRVTCLIVIFFMLSIVGVAFGSEDYQPSYSWGFQNYCYLNFSRAMNFTDTPSLGMPNDSSLIGYWNLNEGLGAVAYDSSGNGNNGTLMNSPTWVTGKYGNALSFSGNGDYVDIPNSNSLNLTNELTIVFWAKFISGNIPAIEKASSYLLYWDGASNIIGAVYLNGTLNYFGASGFLPDGNWHQLAFTYECNGEQALYVDGVSVESGVTPVTPISISASDLRLGFVYGASRAGTVDDVRIYNRTLSAAEVAALYAQPDPVSFQLLQLSGPCH